ncbi:GDSL-type esterase/lipase family protein [Streptomyces sp. NBC_01214]|uniref:GDSL-type esterase/lipase family protein n=1 Tax=Streptomyces sp. NBC_01214 TaxID=2903777 RepID=UPI0022555FC8|nr:GDSL-type esterase/lipase family protein [Streptomyces sp. NBC_01214]MCX4807936.1 GDSL-type esterase/lipase family protein [Streptomyces sp. NBC_01214]
MTESRTHTLFSFGTLMDERVQTALFGRAVPTSPASLAGYTTRPLKITDPAVIAASGLDVHLILERRLGASVEGAVLHLTDRELAEADAYEVDDYTRRRVVLSSGKSAWAYLDAKPLRPAERIVIVGDSIAYGRCDPRGGWAGHLAAAHIAGNETERRLFNLAVPGSTLADVSEQTPALLAARRPDTLLVAAGINDSAVPLADAQGEADTRTDADADADGTAGFAQLTGSLDALAATALDHNARLVVAGPSWLDEDRTRAYEGLRFTRARALALRTFLRAWCGANHIDHLDLWEPLRERSDLLVDGLHPTAEGHRALYEHLDALGR